MKYLGLVAVLFLSSTTFAIEWSDWKTTWNQAAWAKATTNIPTMKEQEKHEPVTGVNTHDPKGGVTTTATANAGWTNPQIDSQSQASITTSRTVIGYPKITTYASLYGYGFPRNQQQQMGSVHAGVSGYCFDWIQVHTTKNVWVHGVLALAGRSEGYLSKPVHGTTVWALFQGGQSIVAKYVVNGDLCYWTWTKTYYPSQVRWSKKLPARETGHTLASGKPQVLPALSCPCHVLVKATSPRIFMGTGVNYVGSTQGKRSTWGARGVNTMFGGAYPVLVHHYTNVNGSAKIISIGD